MTFNTYDVILSGDETKSHQAAIEWANGFVFAEVEAREQRIAYHQFVGSTNDQSVDVWYDFGTDYYFFTEAQS